MARPLLLLALFWTGHCLASWHGSCVKILDVPQSGSVAGQTSSRNRFGQYRRTRAVPVNPNTAAQVAARSRLSELSAGWRDLSGGERDAWATYAEDHPRTDSLGQTVVLTGHQAYIAVNSQRMAFGFAASPDVPTGAPPDAPVVSDITVVIADTQEVTFTPTPVPADNALVIEMCPPQSNGINFCEDYRLLAVAPAAEASPFDISAALAAKWGVLSEGQQLFFRVSLYSSVAGQSPFVKVRTAVSV